MKAGVVKDSVEYLGIEKEFHTAVDDYLQFCKEVEMNKDKMVLWNCAKEDKEKLKEQVENNAYFESMEEDAYDVVVNYVNITESVAMKEYSMEGGKVNMRKGLRDWLEEEVAQGEAKGEAKGEIRGTAMGIVKTARKYHATDEEIIKQLAEELDIDVEVAKQYL